MRAVRINDHLTVSDQPEPAHFSEFAHQGFAAVINVRPDGEDAGQLGTAVEALAAKAAGIGYAFVPVTGSTITAADVRAFQAAVQGAAGPVLAHCRSGTRALVLHAIGEVLDGRMRGEDVGAFGVNHGFDLSGAVQWLELRDAKVPRVEGFYDPRTSSIQYIVADPATKSCAIIDPVLDFNETSGAIATTHADEILDYIRRAGLTVEWILDTHPHADHFSAAHYLAQKTGAPTAIGTNVAAVQALWKEIYNWPEVAADGSHWNRLFADAGGSARGLWKSIQRIVALPDETHLFTGHDYQFGGRNPKWESTVGEQKRSNPHLVNMTEERFVSVREARDRTMPMPKLILHALQVNLRGGRLPDAEDNGRRYLKFPLDALERAAW